MSLINGKTVAREVGVPISPDEFEVETVLQAIYAAGDL
jgi:hypothetical protein